jgi:hypothetical protein
VDLTEAETDKFLRRKRLTGKSPGRFMYRSLSRISLEITGTRVEHLKNISEDGAISEGIRQARLGLCGVAYEWNPNEDCEDYAVIAFQKLWESIHGPGSWQDNPVVRVIQFKRITDHEKDRCPEVPRQSQTPTRKKRIVPS